jgi:L-fuconolactonase
MPMIDTHIHLFDPTRPQGVPWPEKSDAVLYKPALPDRYRRVTKGLGIVVTIEKLAQTSCFSKSAAFPAANL